MVTRFRGVWLVFHRWVGITLGILIAVLGISGSVLVFETEIDASLNPTLLRVTPQGPPRNFNDIVHAAEQAHPGWTALYFEREGDDPAAAYKVVVRDAAKTEKQVFVNPYTLDVLGERSGLTAIALVRRIHADLLVGEPVGSTFVGVFSFLCVAFLVAGLVLWWPAKGKFRRALTVNFGGSSGEPKRLMRELHNVFGAWGAVLLLMACITVPPLVWMGGPAGGGGGSSSGGSGAQQSTSPQGRPQNAPPALTSGEQPSALPRMLTWDEAAAFAASEAPGQYVGFILRNEGPRGFYMVRFWPPGTHTVEKQSNVFIPLTGGRIIRVQRPQPFTLASIYKTEFAANLHSGAILGIPGRIVMFIAGLFFPALFVTGVVMWALGRRRTNA